MKKFGHWIGRAFSEADGSPSTKRILYALAVAFAVGLITAQFIRAGMDISVVDLTKTLLWSTAAAYTGGRFAEAQEECK